MLRVGSGGLGSSWWCLVGLGSLLRIGGYLIAGLAGQFELLVCGVWWWGSFGGLGFDAAELRFGCLGWIVDL